MNRRVWVAVVTVVLVGAGALSGCSATSPAAAAFSGSGAAASQGRARSDYYLYWDQNEELDVIHYPSGAQAHLIPPWDPNGQMCILPDGTGRFVVGYNPTLPSQNNPGGLKPYKAPAVGEALYRRDGTFTGKTLYVPGPFTLPGQTVGGDIPPDIAGGGAFNNNGTFTGCAVDRRADVFATDLGTAQGQFPTPDDGRLIEWFAPRYTTYCVVDGPTAGGVGPHHVDGTGGLRQPGTMAVADNGDLLVPEAGAGRVLRIDRASLPRRAGDCPGGLYPPDKLHVTTFEQGSLAFPLGIARDRSCHCFAITSAIGNPAIMWFDVNGQPVPGHGVVPGTALGDPNGYSPFGVAFAPDGTMYFVDIHVECQGNQVTNCGPADNGGRVMRVAIHDGQPGVPTPIVTGLNFPISVTVCVPSHRVCPRPRHLARAAG